MALTQQTRKSPRNPSKQSKPEPEPVNSHTNITNETNNNSNSSSVLISPRFKSVAEMAGWDEEALLLATLVVEDTPERLLSKRTRRSHLHSNSTGKRRVRQRNSGLIPAMVLNLDDADDDECGGGNKGGNEKEKAVASIKSDSPKKVETATASCSTSSTLPCIDRLREELSCAICLEICYEPSTTPCGHSFCKKCLRSAADKCGKRCPKCRQLISNGRSCTINTVLWNTIQLLFPKEVETRKAAEKPNVVVSETHKSDPITQVQSSTDLNVSRRRLRRVGSTRGGNIIERRGLPDQDDDAALALRLQREEFMAIYAGSTSARENLRAMAQRAISARTRSRAV